MRAIAICEVLLYFPTDCAINIALFKKYLSLESKVKVALQQVLITYTPAVRQTQNHITQIDLK